MFLLALGSFPSLVVCHDLIGRLTYITFQIWLLRNNLIFDVEVIPIHWMLEKAYYLAEEYDHFDAVGQSLDDPSSWGSLTALAVVRKMLFISWEPTPLGFIKINFDGNIMGVEMMRAI